MSTQLYITFRWFTDDEQRLGVELGPFEPPVQLTYEYLKVRTAGGKDLLHIARCEHNAYWYLEPQGRAMLPEGSAGEGDKFTDVLIYTKET